MSSLSLKLDGKSFQVKAHHHEHSFKETFLNVAEKLAAIGLTIYAFQTSATYFTPFFLAGLGVGVYNYIANNNEVDDHSHGGCSHGVIEQLFKVRLPLLIALTAAVAEFASHIGHLPIVFVPLTAITAGTYAGEKVSQFVGKITA